MGSYAIRTRRLDPNTLFRFRTFSEKIASDRPHVGSMLGAILIKKLQFKGNTDFETWFNKGYRQDANNTLCPILEATPPRVRGLVNKKEQSEQETTTIANL